MRVALAIAALAIAASISILTLSTDVNAAPGCGKGVPRTKEGGCAVAGTKQKVGKPTFGPNGIECPPGARLSGSGRNCIKKS
jgi:hypothetical protein